ncbi:AraC family transcriptional regulator, partial [Klebsiella pneumoniae]
MIMAGAKSEMPGSIDKTPRHDEATGWSSTA